MWLIVLILTVLLISNWLMVVLILWERPLGRGDWMIAGSLSMSSLLWAWLLVMVT